MSSPEMRATSVLLQAMRPVQWTKNGVVAAAFFFAVWDPAQRLNAMEAAPRMLWAVLLFCLTSSGVYLVNDILDIQSDRRHPLKRFRPVASGRLPVGRAAGMAALLWTAAGVGAGILLPGRFVLVLGAYVALQMVYSLVLKHLALVDVMVIAAGFVLRAIAGAEAIGVHVSAWLLLCAFLLSLFLALCKRRHEKASLGPDSGTVSQRAALQRYDLKLLDQLIAVAAAATIVAYALYTLSEATVAKFGTERLGWTIPFVIFGLFRYLDLVYRHDLGDRPERILLSDKPLIVDLGLYGLAVILIFLTR